MPKGKGRKKAEDSNLNQWNKILLKWRLERLIFIQLARLCNKKRDELEKTTALKKIREQIKLLADEIRLFKDEATRNKEQRKFTDLHTTLVGEGLIAARPLDSGPPRGGDQGKGGGTLGAYGRMYPKLPLCGPDGEYIFPGGLQESRHSVPVICSTPHVPRKGNPSAPPDYANHDAIQIPQQFPPVRPGTVTKNESINGGFDDNIQPHMKTTDEKKEMARERERFPQSNRDRGRFLPPDRQKEPRPCHNYGQIGHWMRECKAPRKMYRDCSNERVGEENRSGKMRERLKKLQAKSVEELSRLCDSVLETNNNTNLE
ncbi:uncharacterized protein LOC132447845 [Gadus macrocephalus]|uniref:uncharacterized protein LOC132447845 n=1 Tax=Gadus macrocephalus TaxID=80720 RepID=UPI0028CB1BF1|nr:uncharacterized protein LOC132447845 [Gadus macrocephalus]